MRTVKGACLRGSHAPSPPLSVLWSQKTLKAGAEASGRTRYIWDSLPPRRKMSSHSTPRGRTRGHHSAGHVTWPQGALLHSPDTTGMGQLVLQGSLQSLIWAWMAFSRLWIFSRTRSRTPCRQKTSTRR